MRDYRRNKGRITEDGYSLHCNVALISGAITTAGFFSAATAAAVATVGAGTMAVGALTDSRALKNIGGAMMAGGGMLSGGAALMAGGLGTLGTLSAGASLVGGALQGVGMLTGNSKLAGVGALINGAGMAGSAYNSSVVGGGQASATNGIMPAEGQAAGGLSDSYSLATASNAPKVATSGLRVADASQAPGLLGSGTKATGMDAVLSRMVKYDKLIDMAGKGLEMINKNKQHNDMLAQDQAQFDQKFALDKQRSTAVAIPGQVVVNAQPNTTAVQPIAPNYYRRTPSTGLIGARV